MFIYDKTIDRWSHKMIENLTEVWGTQIPRQTRRDKLKTLPFLQNYLNEYFQKYGRKIFLKFYDITDIKHSADDFSYYINTTPVSLHNAKNKYVSIGLYHGFASYPTIVVHELFHLFFYEYIETPQFRAALDKAQIGSATEHKLNEIKEIITVILNDEFKDIIDTPDAGYPNHQIMRDAVLARWRSERNLTTVILHTIETYKKQGRG